MIVSVTLPMSPLKFFPLELLPNCFATASAELPSGRFCAPASAAASACVCSERCA